MISELRRLILSSGRPLRIAGQPPLGRSSGSKIAFEILSIKLEHCDEVSHVDVHAMTYAQMDKTICSITDTFISGVLAVPAPSFAVIDLETTGFRRDHRILEIGVVQLDSQAHIEGSWQTLVQPERDIPNTHIHGISAGDVVRAPLFGQISAELAELIEGRVLIAHNASFDMSFLTQELSRLQVPVDFGSHYLCTMRLSSSMLEGSPKKLADCLRVIDDKNEAPHAALGDAEATARLFQHLYPHLDPRDFPEPLTIVSAVQSAGTGVDKHSPLPRSIRAAAPGQWLRRVSASLPGTGNSDRDAYRDLLATALMDNSLSATEVEYLVSCAAELGMNRDDVAEEHETYMRQMAIEAWADGVVTERERASLLSVAQSLGVAVGIIDRLLAEPIYGDSRPRIELKPGDRVTFTGSTELPREMWEERARQVGLDIGGVCRKSILLVAADPDSRSGKAKQALKLRVPIVPEPEFARLIHDLEVGKELFDAPAAALTTVAEDGQTQSGGEMLQVFPWLSELEELVSGPQMVAKHWISLDPQAPLHNISPRLSSSFAPESFELRLRSTQQWIQNYPEPLTASVNDLGDLRGIGTRRIFEIVELVVLAALDATEKSAEPSTDDEFACDLIEYDDSGEWDAGNTQKIPAELCTLWQWMMVNGLNPDLNAAPDNVHSAWEAAQGLPELANSLPDLVQRSFDEVLSLGAGDNRNAVIVEKRLLGGATLEQLGAEFDVTRERVRQLEKPLLERVLEPEPATAMILSALRRRFLPFARVTHIEECLPELSIASPFGGYSLLEALTKLSNECEIVGPWWQQIGIDNEIAQSLKKAAGPYGVADSVEVATLLGIEAAQLLDRLESTGTHSVLVHGDKLLTAITSYGDRAAALLYLNGEPMDADELIAKMGSGNPRSMSNVVSIDERFTRCALNTWALSEWGYEEFTNIAEHIAKQIDSHGGSYPMHELIAEATRLKVSESSMRAFAATPEFAMSDGIVSHASDSDTKGLTSATPEESRALYWRDNSWQLLITVNHDHLRGSGFGLPRGIAGYLEIPFLGKVLLPSPLGEQTIRVGRTNASCSTIKRFLEELDSREGDRVWLRFDVERGFDVTRATMEKTVDATAENFDAASTLLNLIGFDDCVCSDGEQNTVLEMLNASLGLDPHAPLRRTISRLRHRKEEVLIELVEMLSDAWIPSSQDAH